MNPPDPLGAGAGDGEAAREVARPAKHLSFLQRPWVAAVALILMTFVAYVPVWQAGYIWDDDIMLTRNPFVQAADGLRAIWFSTELPDYFPLTSTALWLQWRLWGPDPLGYHLTNVLLHALAALGWWRVFVGLRIPGAWLAAAVFALHPVNVESVAWVTEIKNTLAMVFYAGSALAYLRFDDTGRKRWYALALAGFALALLSKTAVAPFPLVLLALAWWRRGRVGWTELWRTVPFFALSGALAVVTLWFHHHRAIAGSIVRDDDLMTRLAGAGWAVWFYLSKALLPVNLIFVYPRWEIDGSQPLAYAPLLLALAALGVCWRFRGHWGRGPLFALGYFVALLLPVLGFINISYMRHSLVADRWQYFAILGPIAFATAALVGWLQRFGSRARVLSPVVGAVLLFGLGALTWRQSRIYTDVDTLWRATLARNPDSAVAHNEVGTSLLQEGRIDEAIAHYERSLAAIPNYALAHHNYGCALLKRGNFTAAVARFRIALSHQPKFPQAQHYLGQALLEAGQVDAAMQALRAALALEPDFAETHYRLGTAWLRKMNWEEAIGCFRRAVALEPNSVQAHNDLGVALVQLGKPLEAVTHFEAALAIDSSSAEAHNNVGKIFSHTGRARDAIHHFQTALGLQPDDPDTLANLAWVLATSPDASVRSGLQAIVFAQRANRGARRDDPIILRSLAAAYAETGRFPEARATAERAAALARQHQMNGLAEALASDLRNYTEGAPIREASANAPSAPR